MSGDIRLSNPGGTSIYDSLSIKSEKPVEKPQQTQVAEKPASIPTKDNNAVETPTGKKDAPNVSLVDQKPPTQATKSLPLINSDTGEVLKFKTDNKGLPVLNDQGQLQPDPKGKAVFVKVGADEQPVTDEDGELVFVESAGKVPASNVNLSEEAPAAQPAEATQSAEAAPAQKDSGKVAPLINQETGEVLTLKVDAKGIPVLGADGQLQPDPKGKAVYVKLDENGEPLLNAKGEPQFVGAEGKPMPEMPPQVQTAMESMNAHSAKRLLTGMGYKSMALGVTTKLANTMIKGVSIAVPFTGKAIGFGVKHAVAKAVGAELKVLTAAATKAGTTTIVAATKAATTSATVGTVKALTTAGKLGRGLETIAVAGIKSPKAIAATSRAIAESTKALAPVVKGGASAYVKTVQKAAVGVGEKALEKGVTIGIEKGMTAALKRGGAEVVEKVATKAAQKSIEKVATTAATKAAVSGSAKAGGKLASAVPIIGAVAGAAITAYDVHDAIKKTKDKNTTKLSAGLAWATVGLDVISTAATATGIGAPVGWVATGLSVGTSIASDYFRYKK
ncbi:hypothetical protein EON78_01080 [bacterium]|nr:MAG: hypothetical protein EON78_01080 [bacterium]